MATADKATDNQLKHGWTHKPSSSGMREGQEMADGETVIHRLVEIARQQGMPPRDAALIMILRNMQESDINKLVEVSVQP